MQLEQPNFFSLISDKTRDFVGREWVFEEVDKWLSIEPSKRPKYFMITGKAGSGKSTIAAKLIEMSYHADSGNELVNLSESPERLKNLEQGYLDACYTISFKDNLSTDPKALAKSLSSQLASQNETFKKELVNSINLSDKYDIDIDASQKQIDAKNVSGSSLVINIQGSPTGLSVFNDLVRTPLEILSNKGTKEHFVILIDGLDESITSSIEDYSNSIVSIVSNLSSIGNVSFIITTRDYPNILNKFKSDSFILDISSKKYLDLINNDVSSFILLNLNKNLSLYNYHNESTKKIVSELITKVEGNFLYIKFVMDAIVEEKIPLSMEEINKIPPGLYGMYNLFFDRMKSQYDTDWKKLYVPVLRTLLVSFEGLELNQLSMFTGIEDDMQEILVNLKPFIIVEEFYNSSIPLFRYKLYHQSLVEFLRLEYFEDGTPNVFSISESLAHKKMVEKFYDKSKNEFRLSILNKYAARYLAEHISALNKYNDPEGIDWYQKLVSLTLNIELEQKQLYLLPSETDLPLKTIVTTINCALEKDDPLATASMILLYAKKMNLLLKESPISILINEKIENVIALEKMLKITNLYDVQTRLQWILLICWFLDSKNKSDVSTNILKRFLTSGFDILEDNSESVNFLIHVIYRCHRDALVEILDGLSDDNLFQISELLINSNESNLAYDVFNFIKNKNVLTIQPLLSKLNSRGFFISKYFEVNAFIFHMLKRCLKHVDLDKNSKIGIEILSLVSENAIEEAISLTNSIEEKIFKSESLGFIIQTLSRSNRIQEAIALTNRIDDKYVKSDIVQFIIKTLSRSNRIQEAIDLANNAELYPSRGWYEIVTTVDALSSSNKVHEAIALTNSIEDKYQKSLILANTARYLIGSTRAELAQALVAEVITIANSIDDKSNKSLTLCNAAIILSSSNRTDQAEALFARAITIANTISDNQHRLFTLSIIAGFLSSSNRTDQAQSLFTDVTTIANSIEDKSTKSFALSIAATYFASSNRSEEAQALFTDAITMANSIEEKESREEALWIIIPNLINLKNVREFMNTVGMFGESDNQAKSKYLNKMSRLLVEVNRIDEAQLLCADAINLSENRFDTAFNSMGLALISKNIFVLNKPDDARDLFLEALRFSKSIVDITLRTEILEAMTTTLGSTGRSDEIQALLTEILRFGNSIKVYHVDYMNEVLKRVVRTLANMHRAKEAEQLAYSIEDIKEREETLQSVKKIYHEDNNKYEYNYFEYSLKSDNNDTFGAKVILEKLEIQNMILLELLDVIISDVISDHTINFTYLKIKDSKGAYCYLVKQCIKHPEVMYAICALIMEIYPHQTEGILKLIKTYRF